MVQSMDPIDNSNYEETDESCVPMSPSVSPSVPLDLSMKKPFAFDQQPSPTSDASANTTEMYFRQMSVDDKYVCEPPQIITEPKSDWHYRSAKDLANKHIPYVAGEGPQRTPIRVTVPAKSSKQLHLAIAIETKNGEPHPSKVIVPAKTKADKASVTHDNNLNYLQFDECNSLDKFDHSTRNIYSEITPYEHQVQFKDVRIHMFNLYQSRLITKDFINANQLNLCKLTFWFCTLENGKYEPVSERSSSRIIEETKMTTGSRGTRSNNKPTMVTSSDFLSNVYAMTQNDSDNDDNSFESNSTADQCS